MKLEGKVAIIVGTSPNIGGGIAEGMADEGAKIVCVDINPDFANACSNHIIKRGGEAVPFICDVTVEEQVHGAVEEAKRAFGGVDILVNGARTTFANRGGILDEPLDVFKRQVEIFLTGTFMFTKAVVKSMIEQGRHGNVITIASSEAHQGNPRNLAYGTSKAGLLNFTRSVAMELAPYGIRVNTLTPTSTDPREGQRRAQEWGVRWSRRPGTTYLESGLEDWRDEHRKLTPMQELPSATDYAHAAVFLASDDARMITGFDLRVDAGNIAKYWGYLPKPLGGEGGGVMAPD